MRLIFNIGIERISDAFLGALKAGEKLDIASSAFSLLAFEAMMADRSAVKSCRRILPGAGASMNGVLGSIACRPFQNHIQGRLSASLAAPIKGEDRCPRSRG